MVKKERNGGRFRAASRCLGIRLIFAAQSPILPCALSSFIMKLKGAVFLPGWVLQSFLRYLEKECFGLWHLNDEVIPVKQMGSPYSLKWQLLSSIVLKMVLFASLKFAFPDKKEPVIQIRSVFLTFAVGHGNFFVLEMCCSFPKIFKIYRLLSLDGILLPGDVTVFFLSCPYIWVSSGLFFA